MLDVVDRKNTIRFIKWLKDGKTVLYAPDQDYGMKKSNEIKPKAIDPNYLTNPLRPMISTYVVPSKHELARTICQEHVATNIWSKVA